MFPLSYDLQTLGQAIKPCEVMMLSLVYSWGNFAEYLEIYFRSPHKPGGLPHHSSPLHALKARYDTQGKNVLFCNYNHKKP